MEHKATTARSYLEQILVDETAEPTALPLSLLKDITGAYREWGTCYKIIKGICEGLQYLHDNHIIHLDLKPANILLDDNMEPKIADFGLSRCFDENQSRDITKTILGTIGYLAPEIREGGVIARSADLYSVGVIMLEILTGQKGYQDIGDVLESWSDRLERSQRDTLCEQIRVCYEIALECREFNPKMRPPSARDIIDRLHTMESIQKLRRSAIGILEVEILGARDLAAGVENPYVVAKYGKKWVRTRTLNTTAPQWNEQYTWDVFDLSTVITIAVCNDYHGDANDQRIGKVRVRLATLETDRKYTQCYALMLLSPSGLKKTGELHLAVRFTCKSWTKMLAMYGKPLLPKMHHTNPISVPQLDYLRFQAIQMVATRLGRSEPPLHREVVEYMLDVDSHMFSLRRSKANFYRITSLFSGVVAVGKWFDGICKWKNPLTTILVHVVFLKLVCYPELILPVVFLCMIIIGARNYFRRPQGPPHIDMMLSRVELAHPNEMGVELDTMLRWYKDVSHPDELDEEFDTFPTSKPSDTVRRRYDRLRGLAGMVQTVVGNLAAQGERAQSLLSWRDPRLTPVFIALSLVMPVVLYLIPFRVLTMVVGWYFLRPPWFRGRTNLLLNLYSRLPSKDDVML
uniref:non-specific serine/threonine protein kinase n=1 Tax=Aegilops tauschii subsp. strangulata TaxID=200361 RepID=A0A453DLN0_AEGTS